MKTSEWFVMKPVSLVFIMQNHRVRPQKKPMQENSFPTWVYLVDKKV